MGVNVTRVVKFIRKGDKGSDAVRYWLIPSVSSVSMSDVEDGDGKPTPSSLSCRLVKQVGDDTPTTIVNAPIYGLSISYMFKRNDNVVLKASAYSGGNINVPTNIAYRAIEFYLYQGNILIDTATVAIVCDGQPGEPGKPGQDGEDAISVKVSPQTVVLKRSGNVQRNVRVYVDLFKGDMQIPYSDASQGSMLCSTLTSGDRTITDGLTWDFGSENGRFYYSFIYSGNTDIDMEIPFTVTYNGKQYPEKIIIQTIADGDRGPAMRGPQAWNDCATGYAFQCGAEGEEWKDVVLYDGNYYSCINSHAKTADNYPGSIGDQSNRYWQLGDKIELVATKILLASYALVKNLGVECIDMRDAAGNILFQAKGGNVICKTGTFENVVFSGLLRKKKTTVISANFSDIFIFDESDESYNIDFAKSGTWLELQYLPSDISVYPKGMRALCGNTILLYNRTQFAIGISAPCCTSYDGGPVSFNSIVIGTNQYASLECRIGSYNNIETAYFVAQKGNISNSLDN